MARPQDTAVAATPSERKRRAVRSARWVPIGCDIHCPLSTLACARWAERACSAHAHGHAASVAPPSCAAIGEKKKERAALAVDPKRASLALSTRVWNLAELAAASALSSSHALLQQQQQQQSKRRLWGGEEQTKPKQGGPAACSPVLLWGVSLAVPLLVTSCRLPPVVAPPATDRTPFQSAPAGDGGATAGDRPIQPLSRSHLAVYLLLERRVLPLLPSPGLPLLSLPKCVDEWVARPAVAERIAHLLKVRVGEPGVVPVLLPGARPGTGRPATASRSQVVICTALSIVGEDLVSLSDLAELALRRLALRGARLDVTVRMMLQCQFPV